MYLNDVMTKLITSLVNVLVADSAPNKQYTRSINNLQDIICDVGKSIGFIMLAYGGIKFALAFQKMDQQGEHQAVFSVVSGAVLIGLSAIISALS